MRYVKLFEDFNNIENLSDKLKKYHIPIEKWGTGESKTIKHLFNELQGGECRLAKEEGRLTRFIDFTSVKVFYKHGKSTYFLVEDRQEFKDGRVRKRSTGTSVAEKMKIGEDPLKAAIRGIEEELNIRISRDQIQIDKPLFSSDKESGSYPGLRTKYNKYSFVCYLNSSQFKQEYVEIQEDKSTFFKWIRI